MGFGKLGAQWWPVIIVCVTMFFKCWPNMCTPAVNARFACAWGQFICCLFAFVVFIPKKLLFETVSRQALLLQIVANTIDTTSKAALADSASVTFGEELQSGMVLGTANIVVLLTRKLAAKALGVNHDISTATPRMQFLLRMQCKAKLRCGYAMAASGQVLLSWRLLRHCRDSSNPADISFSTDNKAESTRTFGIVASGHAMVRDGDVWHHNMVVTEWCEDDELELVVAVPTGSHQIESHTRARTAIGAAIRSPFVNVELALHASTSGHQIADDTQLLCTGASRHAHNIHPQHSRYEQRRPWQRRHMIASLHQGTVVVAWCMRCRSPLQFDQLEDLQRQRQTGPVECEWQLRKESRINQTSSIASAGMFVTSNDQHRRVTVRVTNCDVHDTLSLWLRMGDVVGITIEVWDMKVYKCDMA